MTNLYLKQSVLARYTGGVWDNTTFSEKLHMSYFLMDGDTRLGDVFIHCLLNGKWDDATMTYDIPIITNYDSVRLYGKDWDELLDVALSFVTRRLK